MPLGCCIPLPPATCTHAVCACCPPDARPYQTTQLLPPDNNSLVTCIKEDLHMGCVGVRPPGVLFWHGPDNLSTPIRWGLMITFTLPVQLRYPFALIITLQKNDQSAKSMLDLVKQECEVNERDLELFNEEYTVLKSEISAMMDELKSKHDLEKEIADLEKQLEEGNELVRSLRRSMEAAQLCAAAKLHGMRGSF
eukprot:95198-Chlamydomonas_euryale.AAC.2